MKLRDNLLQGIDCMNFANDLSVSSDTKEYMVNSIKPDSEELFILFNVIHFIEWKIWLARFSVDSKEKSTLRIYYCMDELLIFDYSKALFYFIFNE